MMFFSKNRIRVIAFLGLLVMGSHTHAQDSLPQYPPSRFSTYYDQKKSFAETMPLVPNAIVFLGNSITDGAVWSELFPDLPVLSRGFSGDNTEGIINRLPDIVRRKPSKIFLLIGTNDLASGASVDSVYRNIKLISSYVQQQSPRTTLYVQSLLPVNDSYPRFANHTKNTILINQLNEILQDSARANFYTYINLHPAFTNADGKLHARYTNDGLHLTGPGYMLWKHLIYHHVYDLPESPATSASHGHYDADNAFLLHTLTQIGYDKKFKKEAHLLSGFLQQKGWTVPVTEQSQNNTGSIQLHSVNLPDQSAPFRYKIEITADSIDVAARSSAAMKEAVRDLMQLLRDGVMAMGGTIQK